MQPLKAVTTLVFLDIIIFQLPLVCSSNTLTLVLQMPNTAFLSCLNKAVRNIYVTVTYVNDQKPLF